MKVLVTGATGYIGRYLVRRLAKEHEVHGTFKSSSDRLPDCELRRIDLAVPDSLRRLIVELKPDLVIHAAAVANPDLCDNHPDLVRTINVDGTAAAARGAAEIKARLYYLSTDLAFDGEHPPYVEGDPPSPMSLYAESKVEGEQRALELCPDAFVFRMSLVYGWSLGGRQRHTDILDRTFARGQTAKLFSDQVRSMIFIEDAAEMIARLAGSKDLPRSRRVYHVAGVERISRLRFGELFCERFDYNKALIESVRMAEVLKAPRPADCSLDGARLHEAAGFRPRRVEDALRRMRERRRLDPA